VPARTGHRQPSRHRGHPREIHAHDRAPHRKRSFSRLAREHTGKPSGACGTVSVECPHAYEICRELLAREVIVDYRPKAGVRVSPHFYNREDECDFTLTQMDEILKTGAWEKHVAAVTHA